MEQTILRSKVLEILDTGEVFDLVFVTCDRKRGTGGELVSVQGWRKITGEPITTATPGETRRKKSVSLSRDPNHQKHKTVNIYNPLAGGQVHPISVHIRLMQFFNNKRILNG